MTEQPESFYEWLNLCRVWAFLWGCPADSLDDEQRWGARFRRQLSHYMAVQEELDELEFDAEPIPMSREEIDSIVERVIRKHGKKETNAKMTHNQQEQGR
jgi:hypothetical protein